jgi:hypothetical protein
MILGVMYDAVSIGDLEPLRDSEVQGDRHVSGAR